MSRLWSSSRVRVHSAADSLTACLVEGNGRSRAIAGKEQFSFDPGGRAVAWRAFQDWMRSGAQRAIIEWVLGSSEVRYLLLPWTPDLADPTLRGAFARASFEQQFRLDPSLYEVRFANSSYRHAQLAAFVEHTVLTEIKAHSGELQARIARVEPSIATVWDRFSALLGKENGVLCLIDGDRQLIVHHDRTRITHIALRPFNADDPEALFRVGSGEILRVFSSIPTCPALDRIDARLALPHGRGFDAERDVGYAFALCGAI